MTKPTQNTAVANREPPPNPESAKAMSRAPSASPMVAAQEQREVAEVQAAMIIAKRFPRDMRDAEQRILASCTRVSLAEGALYNYNRGGTDITGPSIRLAEVLAQEWGNIQFGIRELSQDPGKSTVEAFAWDIERNVKSFKTFHVPHIRQTKRGQTMLNDPRDIYETVANQGARRLRASILSVIPGDIVEAAVKECEKTLEAQAAVTPERIAAMLEKFAGFGVTKEMIEKRVQRHLDAITPTILVHLGKIYNSLRDGMGAVGDWFEVPASQTIAAAAGESKLDQFERSKESGQPVPAADTQPKKEEPKAAAKPDAAAKIDWRITPELFPTSAEFSEEFRRRLEEDTRTVADVDGMLFENERRIQILRENAGDQYGNALVAAAAERKKALAR